MNDNTQDAIPPIDIGDATSWCEEEYSGLQLGDKRLDRRLVATAAQVMSQPTASLNQACADWAATKASYRLFDNAKVTADKVLEPHQVQVEERMKRYPLVLAVQDTTYIDYSSHPKTEGLGPIGTEEQDLSGFVMHPTLAVTPKGLPLGVLDLQIWVRPTDAPKRTPYEKQCQPIEEKESYKWVQGLEQTVKRTPPGVQVVSVCDREADVFEFMVRAQELKTGFLIRAAQDRALVDLQIGKVWDAAEAAQVSGYLKVHVPAQKNEPEREAITSVRFCTMTLRPPWRPRSPDKEPLPPVDVFVVLVQEEDPPAGVEPLLWLLFSNVPVWSFADAVERIKWYRCRWHIEVYFKVLKSGCRVEDCRLQTAERLTRFLALMCVVAWRLHWLTHIGRHCPDLPCTVVLADHEWRALYVKIHRQPVPSQTLPTVGQAMRWIARLGGFLDRKSDGAPGVTVIWRGWQRLSDISAAWLLFEQTNQEPTTCG
jgi:hypothetical protein